MSYAEAFNILGSPIPTIIGLMDGLMERRAAGGAVTGDWPGTSAAAGLCGSDWAGVGAAIGRCGGRLARRFGRGQTISGLHLCFTAQYGLTTDWRASAARLTGECRSCGLHNRVRIDRAGKAMFHRKPDTRLRAMVAKHMSRRYRARLA